MRMDQLRQKRSSFFLSLTRQWIWIALPLLVEVPSAQATVIPVTMDAYRDDGIVGLYSYWNDPSGMGGVKNDPNKDGDLSDGTMIVNYIGADNIGGLGLYHCKAGLKFTMPITSSTLSSAKLRLKVVEFNGNANATISRTDDNNWEETTVGSTSTFPQEINLIALVTSQPVTSSGWNTFTLPVSDIQGKISSTTAGTMSLIVTGSATENNYFNFIADDDAISNGGSAANNAYLTLTFKPQVQSVSVPANGTYKTGDALNFTISFDSLVNVIGTPKLSLTLNTGGTVQASYVNGSGSRNLVFRYTVASGDADADGVTVGALSLNGGTIRSDNGDDAELALYSVGATTGVKVDAVVPAISNVAPPAGGTYISGQNLDFTATFNKAVNVVATGGTPYITLTIGGVTKHAAYTSGSGTAALTFRYTLASGDAGALATGTGITLNGGTIKDGIGNDATLTFTAPTTTGITVDAVAPTVSGVTPPTSGTYASGQNLDFTATFSKAVNVVTTGGTPYLAMTIGGVTKHAVYTSGNGTTALTFRYTLASGDAGTLATGTGITLNSGTIKDGAGNSATLTFTAPTTTGITVDAVAPTVSGVTPPTSGTYASGQNLDFTATFSKAVNVVTTGGTPYIALTIGGVAKHAVYTSGSGTSALTFRYTLASGDAGALATGTGITLNGGTIKDGVGNDATLTFTAPTTSGITVDTRGSQTIAFDPLSSQTYGTAFVKLTGTASSGLAVSYASGNTAAVRISNDSAYLLAADTATITASQAGNASYLAATSVSQKLTIAKKGLSITGAVATNRTYNGTTAATVTGATLSGVVGSDDVSLALGAATFATKDTGTAKPVTVMGSVLSGTKAGNYSLTEVSGLTASITAYPITVSAIAASKTVGANDPIFAYTAGSLFSGDSWSGALSRDIGESVGAYVIRIGSLSAGPNYAIAFDSAQFTIQVATAIEGANPLHLPKLRDLGLSAVGMLPSRATGFGRAEFGLSRASDEAAQSVSVLLPEAGTISAHIFDLLGTPVISWSQAVDASTLANLDATADGRHVATLSWNLRAANGVAVPAGVYLWKIEVNTVSGQKLETVKKLGVK